MKVFLDSGNPREIQELLERGFVFDGITSNPTTVSAYIKENGGDVYSTVMRIAELPGKYDQEWDISVETIGTPTRDESNAYSPLHLSADRLVREAFEIRKWDPSFTVKLPSTKEGFQAARILYREELLYGRVIPRNMTLGFSRAQGMFSALTGARYYSIFIGRYEDKGLDGMPVVKSTMDDYREKNYPTQILVASVRKPEHITKSLELGAHVITIPRRLVNQMMESQGVDSTIDTLENARRTPVEMKDAPHPITPDADFDESALSPIERTLLEEGLKRFLDDAASVGYSILKR